MKSLGKTEANTNLVNAIKLARISEALDDYSVSGDLNKDSFGRTKKKDESLPIYDEETFWQRFFFSPEKYWDHYFHINRCLVSFWIPRVPGLFHTVIGQKLRVEGYKYKQGSEAEFRKHRILRPLGKSGFVMGGIGTFQLPANEKGDVLTTVSLAFNASSGIPMIVSQKVIADLSLQEGCLIRVKRAQWRKMTVEWAQRFPSMREIKRGCLVVESAEDLEILGKENPIEVHPFSIMEYETNAGILYDFVFVTVNSVEKDYRHLVADFFENYSKAEGRNGKYLTAADVSDPLFDAKYAAPHLLKEDHAGLKLIKHRINNLIIGGSTLDHIADFISRSYRTLDELRAAATHLQIPISKIDNTRHADMVLNLLNYCVEHSKQDELADFISISK